MKNHRFLYHGTSAISVWDSYKVAKTLTVMSKNEWKNTAKILKSINCLDTFKKYGPTYPYISKPASFISNPNASGTCLTIGQFPALLFTRGWKNDPTGKSGNVCFISTAGRRLWINADYYEIFGSSLRNTAHQIRVLSKKTGIATLGTIIITDPERLSQRRLLCPSIGEENIISKFLPWDSIIGILFTNERSYLKFDISLWMNDLYKGPTVDHEDIIKETDKELSKQILRPLKQIDFPKLKDIIIKACS